MFDKLVVLPAIRQLIALSYPSTEGIILSSEVTHKDDGEGGTVHGVSLRYTYSVGGQEYTGRRYRYDTLSSSDCAWANEVVEARPPGTRVQVFYDAHDPHNSVLATGLFGSDLFMLAFMTPFNAVMLGFWSFGWTRLRLAWFKPIAGGVKIIMKPGQIRARLTPWSPVWAALATMALLAFCSIFVVGFNGHGFHPSIRTMVVAWAIILCGGMAAGAWYAIKTICGSYDLVIDEIDGTLDLPPTQGRKSRRRILLRDIEGVYVEIIQKPSTNNEPESPFYAPTLRVEGTNSQSEHLVQWLDQTKAAQFAQWLRRQLPQRTPSSRPLAAKF